MILLNNFQPDSKVKSLDMHLCQPEVPQFWKGFYAVFYDSKKKIYKKYFFSGDKSKKINTAIKLIDTDTAHEFYRSNTHKLTAVLSNE